ncbi:anti-sigma factor family protein [Paenibacillus alginolyticus]|uniref:Anti-sigma-W factor RsiW n=1 Tax=Paenibacillus alginolyticus TaxID=59839 RepID=A0ABT4G5N6_9BACL|nr:zf-HC2 domain-containing protein [Paenibacillus alginolyticus]MCY9691475.1 zf-HC2 domain-containing protein [Paenibacillus alginolyticus]MEC0146585.1 anti-sigma factor [Paenibacillus alginolyticus]
MSNHIEDLLSAYMDNELTESERQQVEEHLNTCSECSAVLNDVMDLKNQVFAAFHSIEAPEGLEDKVIRAIGSNVYHENVSRGRNWLLVPLVSALCIISIVFVFAGSFLFKMGLIMFKVTYNLINVFGNILGSNTYTIVGLIGFSILLIVASSISLKYLLKTKEFRGASW